MKRYITFEGMKRNIFWLSFMILSVAVIFAFQIANNSEDIKGTYINKEETAHIRIFKATDGKYYGKTEWLKIPNDENGKPKTDINNPDPNKRNEPRMGMVIAKGFDWDEKSKRWTGGTIYDPNNGKTYSGYMYFENGDLNTLNLRGYVMGMTFLGRTSQWKRVNK
jgi:uncharacterized protein (DUF2147 family)